MGLPHLPSFFMHSDAADVEYGVTLGFNPRAGSPGLWAAQGFWTAEDSLKSITLRVLRAVRLLLHRAFAAYVCNPHFRTLLVHE